MMEIERSKPTVGVAMAAHRAADTIGKTLQALLDQTVPPNRIVVAIDGPDPDTEAVVRTFEPEVECIVMPVNTGGPGGPRNVAVRHIQNTGDVDAYCFMDADDIPYPKFLEVGVELMALHPECPIIYLGFDLWHPPEPIPSPDDSVGTVHSWTLDDYLERSGSELLGFALIRSEKCRNARSSGVPFDPALTRNQDYDLTVRLLADSPAVATTWRGAAYRIYPTSHSSSGVHAWLSRLLATELLGRDFRASGRWELVAKVDRAAGSALRRAARHLWIRHTQGDRWMAMRLLFDDILQRKDLRSLAVMITLGLGIDRKAARMSSRDHRQLDRTRLEVGS